MTRAGQDRVVLLVVPPQATTAAAGSAMAMAADAANSTGPADSLAAARMGREDPAPPYASSLPSPPGPGRLLLDVPGISISGPLTSPPVGGHPKVRRTMAIEPAQLARSLGALDTLDVVPGFTGTLQRVLRSARTLLEVDMAGLMLVDHAGTLRWAGAADPMVQTHVGELEQFAHGPCTVAFAQRAPAAIPDRSVNLAGANSPRRLDIHAGLRCPSSLVVARWGHWMSSHRPKGVGRQRDGRPAGLCRAGRERACRRGDGAGHGPAGRPAAGSRGAPVAARAGHRVPGPP